jgi:uncharacterized YigZ family protein
MDIETKALHPQAVHVVHAAIVGNRADQFSYSDDREPKNTAGRPALEVLKGSGITNILVLIIRYFGGTLLGTGGLVKAYGDVTKEVLSTLKTEELIEKQSLSVVIGYDLFEMVKLIIKEHQGTSTEEFATQVTLNIILPKSESALLIERITNLSGAQATIKVL